MKNITLLLITSLVFAACGSAENKTTDTSTDSSVEMNEAPSVKDLAQTELAGKLKDSSVILIDVRTPSEVADGYIPEAGQFIDINGDNFETEIGKLDKNANYVMYCRYGGRSGRAAAYMIENGFTNVSNLEGGFMNYTGEKAKP